MYGAQISERGGELSRAGVGGDGDSASSDQHTSRAGTEEAGLVSGNSQNLTSVAENKVVVVARGWRGRRQRLEG